MSALPSVQSWVNKGQPRNVWPEWLASRVVGKPEPNGSLLIKVKLGTARCHRQHMVFLYEDHAYVCENGEEARKMLAEMVTPPFSHTPEPSAPKRLSQREVADRRDDTDDISRAICLGVPIEELHTVPGFVSTSRPAPSEPQKSAPAAPKPAAKPASPAPAKATGKSHKWPAQIGVPPSLDNRPVDDLNIDDSYQRSTDARTSQVLIRKIANSWDWRMCHPLVVSKREDDTLYVIDGQHRLAAAKLRGDIPWLPCVIGRYGSIEDEAAMFVAMNRQRRQVNRLDEFHAAQAGNDPEALAIAALIEEAGFMVSRRTGSASWVPGEVAFTSAISNIYRKHGEAIPRRALKMMAEAFPDQRLVVGSPVFTALCRLMLAPPEGFDITTLPVGLRKFDMAGWASFISDVKGGTDRSQAIREMMIAACDDVAKEAA